MPQSLIRKLLNESTYTRLSDLKLPRRASYTPSPVSWQNEVIYFLMIDRFSDGKEHHEKLLDRTSIRELRGEEWNWKDWAYSGAHRWQGGTLKGVMSKLDYLEQLGITTLWMSPVFKQRKHKEDYHGYGIQNFLEVDPHFGTKDDLIRLVDAAHEKGIRVILDIIFNHSGPNWNYPGNESLPPYIHYPNRYEFGNWLDGEGNPIDKIQSKEDGVYPEELQDTDFYTRAGVGDLGAGDTGDRFAEHKRSDFYSLRDFHVSNDTTLTLIAKCFKYWIALTDCDGFRLDTLKHVSTEEGRNFCGTVKEFANNIGKENFLLLGEIAGGSNFQAQYLNAIEHNLDAALDIGDMRPRLSTLGKGLANPFVYFSGFEGFPDSMGSHRMLGDKHVSILNDHDHVIGEKLRFSVGVSQPHQVVVPVAIQLCTLGIPCIYYGTEQALAGPEASEWKWLPAWGGGDHADRYLREAMFGPDHPLVEAGKDYTHDETLPGFGPFGTAGYHCFDVNHPAYVRIQQLTAVRRNYPVLRFGRQYLRQISFLDAPFDIYGNGEIVAWSRILDEEECLVVVNVNGVEKRGAKIMVDSSLNFQDSTFHVLLNTSVNLEDYQSIYVEGDEIRVQVDQNNNHYIEIYHLDPCEVIILNNRYE